MHVRGTNPAGGRVATMLSSGDRLIELDSAPTRSRSIVGSRIGLLAVCALAVFSASAGIMDEGHVSLQGDMPRYMMNGAFVYDLIRDRPFSSPHAVVEYAQLYYARYPALSLGHHPPLLAAIEAAFYLPFGISVRSARLVETVSFAAAVAFLYLIVRRLYDWLTASFAAGLLATSPLLTELARSVLSEIPALALLVAAAFFLLRFCAGQRRSDLIGFVAAASLSLYAKQLAIFAFPAFAAMLVLTMGPRAFVRRDVLLATAAIAALSLPIVPLTLALSPTNVAITMSAPTYSAAARLGPIARSAFTSQFVPAVLVLAALGAAVGIARRDWRAVLFLVWTVSVFVCMRIAAPWEPARYSIYLAPAVCALAAAAAAAWRNRLVAATVMAVLAASIAVQARHGVRHDLPGATGYEEAAEFVLASNPGPTVLFSGDVDTGYFTFFVRKHDPGRTLVVLRSDKLLTTSMMARPAIADRIAAPSEIYEQLKKFGTRYIVVEDRPSVSRVLEWLRQELRTPNFAERRRIHIGSSDHRLRGTDLVVYEFLGSTPPQPGAVLSMNLPLVHRSVAVPLADLVDRKYLR